MTSLAIEHFATASSSGREARGLSYAEDWAVDELSGRTVWCATGLTRGKNAARAMQAQLREFAPRELNVMAGDALRQLTQRLDTMLHGEAGGVGPADREVCAGARANGDALVGDGVRTGDLVVLHDPLAVILAEAVRERGAHAVWHLELVPEAPMPTRAREFLREFTWPAHACVMAWGTRHGGHRIVTLLPSSDVVAVKEADETGRGDRVAWATALAEVIRDDRAETVGGTLHARPVVAAR